MPIPYYIRLTKHLVFGLLPGKVGLRNRACAHHLTKGSVVGAFEAVLSGVDAGDICIDCGANVGLFTERMAATGATVFAFEPDPWTYRQLDAKFRRKTNVIVRNEAVGVCDGIINFYRDADFELNPNAHSLSSSVIERSDRKQVALEVPVINFINFLSKIPDPIKVIKMDIEGAEVELLEALLQSDQAKKLRSVFVETHELQFPQLLRRTWKLREDAKKLDHASFNFDWH